MSKESEHAQPIVDGDENDVLAREGLTVVAIFAARARLEPATVNPHHHGHALARPLGRCPDVERQAVLALLFEVDVAEDLPLEAGQAERGRVLDAGPRDRRT